MNKIIVVTICSLGLLVSGAHGDVAGLKAWEDTFTDSVDTSAVFGDEDMLTTQGYAPGIRSLGSARHTFLKFKLDGAIPSDATITGAVFGIFYAGQNSGGYSTLDPSAFLYYVGEDGWSEGTLDWDAGEALPFDSDPIGADPVTLGDIDTAHEWDLFSGSGFNWTDWQQDLNDGYISFLMTVELENLNNFGDFYSSEYSDAALRPYLNITYTCPVVPEPTSMVMGLIGISGTMAAVRTRKGKA